MSFIETIQSWFKFSGRASRREFWSFFVIYLVLIFALSVGASLLGSSALVWVPIIAFVALLVAYLAVAVRRLHDTDHSGWWLLISIIPGGSLVLLYFFASGSKDGDNRFGAHPYRPGMAPAETPQVPAGWGSSS